MQPRASRSVSWRRRPDPQHGPANGSSCQPRRPPRMSANSALRAAKSGMVLLLHSERSVGKPQRRRLWTTRPWISLRTFEKFLTTIFASIRKLKQFRSTIKGLLTTRWPFSFYSGSLVQQLATDTPRPRRVGCHMSSVSVVSVGPGPTDRGVSVGGPRSDP